MNHQAEAVIKTEAELAAERERAEQQKEEREKLSKERKLKMKELERRAVLLAKKSDIEIAEAAKKQTIRALAEEQIDNNSDVVKLLNSMAQRATAFTIREKQLEEKHRLEKVEQEFDRRMDILIEIDRIKDIQRREEEEKEKRAKRVEDRQVLNEQIAQRQRLRLLQVEARDQENVAMRNTMKKYEEDDKVAAEKRRELIEKSKAEVLLANDAAIRRKRELKEAEKKEVEDILIYQAQKDAELARREEEEAAIERMKKERQAKLLAQQEKAQNNQGKLDELRARRAAEEKERQTRQREKEEAIKRKAEMKELLDSRAKQAADKIERQKIAKQQADEEILYQLQYAKKMEDRENAEARAKQEKVADFKAKLHAQIEDVQRQRKMFEFIIEMHAIFGLIFCFLFSAAMTPQAGLNIHEELIREEAKLKVIRDKMVADLEAQGVDPKYLSEMKMVDVGKMLRR